jgi:molecular chaperone DnaK
VSSDPIIGIDLGTSNCCVAVVEANGQARVLADEEGRNITPSVISFHPSGKVLIGHEAKQRRVIDPRHTVFSFKRIMGRRFGSTEVTQAAQRSSFVIKPGANEQPMVQVRAGEFSPPELSAILLDHMRNIAAKRMGTEVKRAVVTVPANFNDAQRQATALAGEIGELVVVRILNEPTAAALAYGHGRSLKQTVAVYDFGGGTFDVTLLALRDNVYEVLATAGDTFLGGDDFDERLVQHMADLFLHKQRLDLRADDLAVQRLRAVAEQVKCELSLRPRAVVTVQEIAIGVGGQPLDLDFSMTRDELVKLTGDLIERSFPVCDEAFRLAGLATSQIDEVVLVGGTTRIPYLRERVTQFFGRAPRADVNPDEAVAIGAALQGAALAQLLDKPRKTLGHGVVPPPPPPDALRQRRASQPPPLPGSAAPPPVSALPPAPPPVPPAIGRMPINKLAVPQPRAQTPDVREITAAERLDFSGQVLPTETRGGEFGGDTGIATNERTFTREAPGGPGAATSGGGLGAMFDDQSPTGVSPDAITRPQATGATGSVAARPAPSAPLPRPVLLDVTPRGLCVATVGGYCDEIIKRNSQIPIEQTRVFSTAQDRQTSVEIKIGQGESRRFDENTLLGSLVLEGLEPRPRGAAKIAVTFEIDTDGILQVRAVDEHTRRQQAARIQLLGVLGDTDVDAARDKIRELRAR